MSYRKDQQRYGARNSNQDGYYQNRGFGKAWSDFQFSRDQGWGMDWYRNRAEGKIGGVAAGLADAWRLEHWMVRLGFVAAFLFTGTLAFWVYVAGWVMLTSNRPPLAEPLHERQSRTSDRSRRSAYRERPNTEREYRPQAPYRYRPSASSELSAARDRIKAASARVRRMEAYLTSRRYKLDQAFREL